ncbi:MAG: SPOR domain-containing protein, partial [Longimicrobiales bacterium]
VEQPALTEPHVPRAAPRPRPIRRSPREILPALGIRLPALGIPRSRRVITGAIVLILIALAGIWQLGRGYLGARRDVPETATPEAPAAARPSALTGEPSGVALPYSVAIEAHQDLPTAVRRVESLARVEPAVGFYIAPILVDSALYYRVMAGPVTDSTAAANVMESLIRRGHKTGGSDWDIRATPYAFRLGEYELREQAEQRMKELQQLDIPSYVLEVPFTNGPPRYYLYSGAYSGPAEADVMRKLLRSAGLNETLVERTGRSPT